MIPIGAPVTAAMPGGIKVDGFVLKVESYMKRPAYKIGYMWYFENEVKIRYDNPAPFTLWQLSVLSGQDVNKAWYEHGNKYFPKGCPRLAPDQINDYWNHFNLYVSVD